jgi:hypothetical protein
MLMILSTCVEPADPPVRAGPLLRAVEAGSRHRLEQDLVDELWTLPEPDNARDAARDSERIPSRRCLLRLCCDAPSI